MKLTQAILATIVTAAIFGLSGSARAQGNGPGTVVIFGNDACPANMICVRAPESERYRIPKGLRGERGRALAERWGDRAQSIEYAGASGIQSCSPVGAGGASGCFAQMARARDRENQQNRDEVADSALPY